LETPRYINLATR